MTRIPARSVRPLGISLARFSSSLAIAAAMALAGTARTQAAILDWDPAGDLSNSGGSGPWNVTSPFWNNAGIDQIWSNAGLDTARFGGAAGTVTLSTGITAGGLNFNVDGMVLTGNTLTLGGATPMINVTAGANATISSTLTGTAGAIITGGGTLILSPSNSISGLWDITAGTVRAMNLGALGGAGASAQIDPGATLEFNAGGGNLNTAIILNGGTLRQIPQADLTTQAAITVNAASTIDISAGGNYGKIFVNAGINGTGDLTKNGANGILQIVQGNLGYSGNWTLNGGYIEAQNANALGTGTVTVNGGELVASNNSIPNAIIIGTPAATLSFNNGNLGNFRGPINAVTDFNVALKDFYQNQARNGEISGNLSGTGSMNILNPPSAVSLTLTGDNSAWSGLISVPTNVQLRARFGPGGNSLGTNGIAGLSVNGSLVLITTPNLAVGPDAGFTARYYNSLLLGSGVIGGFDFGLRTAAGTRLESVISIPDNGGGLFPNPAIPGFSPFNNGALWTGVLQITGGGSYSFFTTSDDGSLLYVDGRQVVQNDFAQGETERSGRVDLAPGLHSIIVKFGQGVGGAGVQANYQGPDTSESKVLIGSIAGTVTSNVAAGAALGSNLITDALNLGASGVGGFELAGTNTTVTGSLLLQNGLGLSVTGVTGFETLTQAGPVTLNGDHTFTLGVNQVVNGVQNGPAGADMVISGSISEGTPGSTITKTGPRTLTLSGTNTFTGATTVINGVLQLDSPVLNSGVGPGGLVLNPTAGSSVVRLLRSEQLPNAAVLSVSSVGENTARVDLNGFNETVGGLTVTATAGSNTGVSTGAGGSLIVTGDIVLNNNRVATTNTGREALITGTGTYTVAASNGTLNLGGAVRNITVETTNTEINLPGSVAGSNATIETGITNGGINKLGSRTLILNGASSYAGGTVINQGIVRAVGASGATSSVLGTGTVTLNGGSLELRNNGTGSNGTITYGNNLVIDSSQSSGLIDVNNNGTNTGNVLSLGNLAIGGQILNVTGGNAYGLRFSSATLSGNATVNLTTPGASLTLNNVSGPFSLTKSATSPGVLILSGNGTFTGGTTVPLGSGPLRLIPAVGSANQPAGTGAISLATGTTLQIAPVITSLSAAGATAGSLSAKFYNGATTIATGSYGTIPTASTTVALLADGTFFNRPAVLTSAAGSPLLGVYSGLLNITTAGAYSFQTAVQDASQLVIDGVPVISVNAAGGSQSLTDSATSAPITLSAGFHTIVMKAFNGNAGGGFRVRYTGADTGGNLQVISPTRLYSTPVLANVGNTGSPVTLAAGANISLDGVASDLDSSVSTLTLGAGSTLNAVNAGGSGVLSVAGITTLQGAVVLNPISAALNLVGNVADGGGNFAISKVGVGTLVLTGAKTFGGTLTISTGGVQVTNATSLGGTAAGTIVSAGAVLDLNGTALGSEPLTISGAGTTTAAAALYNSSSTAASASGPITLGAAGTKVGGFGDLTLSGIISGVVGNDLAKIGGDTLTLSGVNTFLSPFTVSAGIVKLGDNAALGATSAGTTVASGATLDLNGRTIAEPLTLNGAGLANLGAANTLGALINTSATPATVSGTVALAAITGIGSGTLTGGGNITLGGIISGAFALNKVGGNALTLTAANTYTGAGTVQLGTLILSGAGTVTAESSMNVHPTATLTLDDTGTNNTTGSRLGAKRLSLIGGNFNILGNAGANTVEDLGTGAFQIDTDYSIVTLTPGGATRNVRFSATSLARTGTFTTKGTALFRGTGLGTGASGTGGIANITFTTAPTPTGQTGAAGTLNRGILPWALVDTTLAGAGSSFATYSATNGLQALQAGDFTAALNGASLNNNVIATTPLNSPVGGLTINSLTLRGGSSLAIGTGNNLTLDSGGLLATTSATISGAGVLTTTSNREIIIHSTGGVGTILTVGTPIATGGGLTKSGDGTLRLTAQNTFTGQTRLNGGTTILAGGANTMFYPVSTPPAAGATAAATTSNILFVDAGATLDLNGNDQRVGGLATNAGVGSNFAGTSGTITNTSGTAANFRFSRVGTANTIPTILAGNLNIQRDGIGTLTFTSPNTYTGTTLLTGGVVVLQDAGTFANTSSIGIRRAVLRLDNSGLQTATRVPAAAPVALNGGAVVFLSRSGGAQDALNLGATTLQSGASVIQQSLGGTASTSAAGTSTVNLASLARSQGATITFSAAANNNVEVGDNPRVLLGTGTPALTGGLVGGWATTQGYNSATPLSGVNSFDFAAYDPVTGFRPASYTAAFGVGSNVNLEPNNAAAATTLLLSGNYDANSLRIGGTGTTTSSTLAFSSATDILNLQTGGLLGTAGNIVKNIGANADDGRLTAGGAASSGTVELFIHNAANTLTVNSQIINNPAGAQVAVVLGGLSQNGTIQLSGVNSYTGTTYANGVNVNLNAAGLAIPGNLIISGGTANASDSQATANQTVRLLANDQIASTATVTVNGGGTLSLNGFNNTLASLVFAADGGSAGGIGPVVQTGTGALTLTGGITATSLQATSIPVLSGNVTLPPGVHTVAIGAVPGAPGQVGLQINAAMTGGGSLNVTSGVLGLGGTVSTADLNLSAGTTLSVFNLVTATTVTPTIDALTGSGTITAAVTGTGKVVLAVGNDNGSGTFTGTVSGPLGLKKIGSGNQTITQGLSLASLSVDDGILTFGAGPGPAPFAPEMNLAPALVVPEPGSIALLLTGALGMLARRRRE